jgi:hypothetical protein
MRFRFTSLVLSALWLSGPLGLPAAHAQNNESGEPRNNGEVLGSVNAVTAVADLALDAR